MQRIAFLLLLAAWWMPVQAGNAAAEDGKKIEGTWRPLVAELAGDRLSDETLQKMKLVMADGNYTFEEASLDKGTYTLDTSQKPKAMDIRGTEGPNRGKLFLAIYELKGDTLRICYDLEGVKRPVEFKTEKNVQQFLVTYKRQKP